MKLAAVSLLFARDIEVYSRTCGVIPYLIQTTLNGPTHKEPIRFLEYGEDKFHLLIKPRLMEE
jgi:hypothetical protein